MTINQSSTSGLIDVGATTLYHELHGRGPALLLISGGGDDAGQWTRLSPALAEQFTVLTYDRRGLSRSSRPDGWTSTNMDEQADDAAALLRALDLSPAVVVGHSGGASVACALVARHPETVRQAVFYEPPLLAVVPDSEEVLDGFQAMVDQAMAEGGPPHAMEVFIRANAGDETYDAWFASVDAAYRERLFENAATFFAIELPAFATFIPDRDRMRESGVPMTVVVGEDNRDAWYAAAARWLVEGAGASYAEMPGGHGGFETHQEDFLALMRRIGLDAATDTPLPARR